VRALGLLQQTIPGYLNEGDIPDYHRGKTIAISQPFASVSRHVREAFAFKQKSATSYAGRVTGFKDALSYDIANAPRDAVREDDVRVDWLKRFLRLDRILKHLRPNVDHDGLLNRVEFDRCPALKLWWAIREQRIRQANAPKDNDVDDWAFLQVLPSADLVFTERTLTSDVLRGDRSLSSRIVADPREVKRIMHAWGE
jgi:hypothetical protein